VTAFALMRTERQARLASDEFARAAGLHPDLLRRLVAMGLVEAARDASGELWFSPAQLVVAARLQRLRAGFGLNYAALGLVCDLLDRIAELEAMTRTRPPSTGGRTWTSTG
jgi:DNA-binding transcriptional MerR regulator